MSRKVLISACVMGQNVRWNGQNKKYDEIRDWAQENDVSLVPVCPENELFGSPRAAIRLRQIDDRVAALMKGVDVFDDLTSQFEEITRRHEDRAGFIGIARSPTCGISAGVKDRGSTIKAAMHVACNFPTTEINSLKSPKGRDIFLRRIEKHESR